MDESMNSVQSSTMLRRPDKGSLGRCQAGEPFRYEDGGFDFVGALVHGRS